MSRDFPDWVHPVKAAAARRTFTGSMPIERLTRLEGLVVPGRGGEVHFSIAFSHDDQQQVRADVEVSGFVPLECQRSLKDFDQPIESASTVGIVASDEEAGGLPEDYEPKVCPDSRLSLVDLIAEEVLLSLPLVPVDPESTRLEPEPGRSDTHRPFEALAGLKKKSR
ncbi:MAG: YceD family protein [Wenzhouxiangella sp.]|jgi:uncharacterized protein|nr:YceD family protein [Wenzhouxiangella sp.]